MIKIQNKRTVVMALVAAVVLIAVTGLLVFPAMSDIKRLNNEILARRIELERLYLQGQSIRKVTDDLERAMTDLPRIEESLPRAGEELAFITTLEAIAARNRLNSHLEFLPRTDAPAIGRLSSSAFEIKLEGSFGSVYQYLAELDRLPYYVFVQTLSIQGAAGSGASIRRGGTGSAPDAFPAADASRSVSTTFQGRLYWRNE